MIQFWAVFSISAAFIWAITNVIDKYIVSKLISKPALPVIIAGIIAFIVSVAVLFYYGFYGLSFYQLFLALVAGVIYGLALLLYFKAVKIGDISSLIPIYHLISLFIAVIAWFVLAERFSAIKYVGIIMLIAGAFLVSWDNKHPFKFGKPFWLMIAATFLLAVNQIITKYLLQFADFLTIFAYVGIGFFLATVPLLCKNYSDFRGLFGKNKEAAALSALSEIMNRVGQALVTYAAAIGPVTLVNAIISIQPFFVLSFAVIFSAFYPQILKEEGIKSKIFLKVVAISIMFIGGILVS